MATRAPSVLLRGAAVVAALAGCDSPRSTQLLVVVSSEPPDGRFIARVEVEVRSADDRTTYDRASFDLGDARSLPLSLGVAPRGDDASERVRVVARGLWTEGGGLRRVETVAITGFLADQRLVLPLVLDARCVEHRGCPASLTCGEGFCVPAERDPSTLDALPPGRSAPVADGGACVGAPLDDAGRCDRCAEGNRVAVARGFSTTRAFVYSTDGAQVDCCGHRSVNLEAFFVYPSPRPDLLPFYICRMGDGRLLYTLLRNCEGVGTNLGVLGYLLPPVTPGRCGAVPLYRLYRRDGNEHLYTTDARERDELLRRQGSERFVDEGISAYVWAGR